ncbi:unnamed protein product [Phytophthora lilii]|uniref:Unnamed protein product n=1 Tax=Phytophthora lilii TaxID=2077276 RepID=A0A9W6THB9_9STRA|nr:unnamed protein product [Phytophthora lilii]
METPLPLHPRRAQQLFQVTLVLTKDGSALQITSEHDEIEATSIALLDITGITVQTAPLFSFSLQSDVEDIEDDNNERSGVMTPDTFVAPNADVLTRWVVALTCGINAFQQQHQQQSSKPSSSDGKAAELVWQAVRLRIFELATVIPLPTAIEYVIVTIPQNDLQQCKALRERLQFLRCGGSAA